MPGQRLLLPSIIFSNFFADGMSDSALIMELADHLMCCHMIMVYWVLMCVGALLRV